MSSIDELRSEYAHAANEYNLLLGAMDSEVERVIWKAARDAAQKAFEYQERADDLRARGGGAMANAEALCQETGATVFRAAAHEFMRMTDDVPSFARAAALPIKAPF